MEQEELTINGTRYVRADQVEAQAQPKPKPGKRAVIVVDRGWIFAGDLDEETKPGRILLTRAVWVFRWDGVGFAAVIEKPQYKTDIRKIADVDVPADAEIFRVPVSDDWGL